jgi:aspartate carbamoyltransferase catalytic subunit
VIKKVPALRGPHGREPLLRELDAHADHLRAGGEALSADVINFSTSGPASRKGESLKDTALTLQAMGADAIVIRHSSSGSPHQLTKWVRGSVLNAGDGTHEHPTQALLDLYTMRERLGPSRGCASRSSATCCTRGSRGRSRSAREDGADVTLVGRPTLIPPDAPAWGVQVSYDIGRGLPKLDVCTCCASRRERQRLEYFPSVASTRRLFGLTASASACCPRAR